MGLSVTAYAASRKKRGLPGGSRYGVQKALQAGRLRKEPDGTIDPERADRDWEGNTDPDRQASDVRPATYSEARAIREALNARIARLEYEERLGKLVDAAEVRREAYRTGRVLRDRVLAVPGRVAAQAAAESSAKRIQSLMDQELRRALDEVLDGGTEAAE